MPFIHPAPRNIRGLKAGAYSARIFRLLSVLAGLVMLGMALASVATAQTAGGSSTPTPVPAPSPPPLSSPSGTIAILGGLDKITARVTDIEAPVDVPVTFGALKIIVRACHKRPPEEPPETTAYLQVFDVRGRDQPKPVFEGWMFASSPALSALEHPVYDLWIKDCKIVSGPSSTARAK